MLAAVHVCGWHTQPVMLDVLGLQLQVPHVGVAELLLKAELSTLPRVRLAPGYESIDAPGGLQVRLACCLQQSGTSSVLSNSCPAAEV